MIEAIEKMMRAAARVNTPVTVHAEDYQLRK